MGEWAGPLIAGREEPKDEETESSPARRPSRLGSFAGRIAFDLFCLAWIVPIVILLILNFNSWVVGAGVGCRLKLRKDGCYIDLLSTDGPDTAERAKRLDKRDHEILGGLQFVAKGLEVWFTIIAASLIYDLTILLALKIGGLPIGYLMTHAEFGDILTLFESTFWGPSGLFRHGHRGGRARRFWLFAFVLLATVLCIACNLMGPSTAVLVLPTLGWSQIDYPISQRFGRMASSDPPANPAIAPGCNASSLSNGDYTCTGYYSSSLDAHSSISLFNYEELSREYSTQTSLGGESGLSFAYNLTDVNGAVWVPNRQVLRDVSNDYVVYQASQGINQTFEDAVSFATQNAGRSIDRGLFDSYRNALDVKLFRKGPSMGLSSFCNRANVAEIALSDTKSVRCYNYTFVVGDYAVECFRTGEGWNEAGFAHSQFSIGNADIHSTGNVSVDVYSVLGGIFLNGSSLSCASPTESAQSCDWDIMFSANPPSDVTEDPGNLQLVEYSSPSLLGSNATVWCLNIVNVTTLDYVIDVSPDANTLGLVTLNAPSVQGGGRQDTIQLHPDWILAAWAVPRSGTVDGDRAAALNSVRTFKAAANSQPPATLNDTALIPDPDMDPFFSQHYLVSLHAVSLVDFTTINVTESSAHTTDPSHPPLPVSRSLRVWSYGHESHTFKLGAAVSLFGCLCVLLRVAIGFFFTSRRRSTLKFLAAAMKYSPQGEFDGLEKESDWARVEVIVSHDDMGKVEFFPRQEG
ncbi:hypothetical protein FGG08_006659 [Glutinoglossum americanum]|uniref:Uncharacterized protein n=1 Tax=Glutinoglossum americanum TaxID=1670608 RepID=A0A9P8I0F8_9PEZI|nr:hypothetical protein FGG08_006659 [Glutinoglossum americanum]